MKTINEPNDIIQYNYGFYLVEFPTIGYTLDHMNEKKYGMWNMGMDKLSISTVVPDIIKPCRIKDREEYFREFVEFCSIGISRQVVCTNTKNLLNFNYLDYYKKYQEARVRLSTNEQICFRLDLLFQFNIISICTFLGLSEKKLKNEDFIVRGAINRLNAKINHEASKQ
jgi:hypothetical protein